MFTNSQKDESSTPKNWMNSIGSNYTDSTECSDINFGLASKSMLEEYSLQSPSKLWDKEQIRVLPSEVSSATQPDDLPSNQLIISDWLLLNYDLINSCLLL